jgi:DNA-binding MltR family transcriptional regulator
MKKKDRQQEIAKARDFQGLFDELGQEKDRGAALLAAALLDNNLAALIEAFLIDDVGAKRGAQSEVEKLLYEPNAPLASLSSRTRAAYCLGLISEEAFRDVELMRDIRNRFAHRLHGLSFETAAIKAMCERLSYVQRMNALNAGMASTAREKFILAAALYWSQLSGLKALAKHRRKTPRTLIGFFPVMGKTP